MPWRAIWNLRRDVYLLSQTNCAHWIRSRTGGSKDGSFSLWHLSLVHNRWELEMGRNYFSVSCDLAQVFFHDFADCITSGCCTVLYVGPSYLCTASIEAKAAVQLSQSIVNKTHKILDIYRMGELRPMWRKGKKLNEMGDKWLVTSRHSITNHPIPWM